MSRSLDKFETDQQKHFEDLVVREVAWIITTVVNVNRWPGWSLKEAEVRDLIRKIRQAGEYDPESDNPVERLVGRICLEAKLI